LIFFRRTWKSQLDIDLGNHQRKSGVGLIGQILERQLLGIEELGKRELQMVGEAELKNKYCQEE